MLLLEFVDRLEIAVEVLAVVIPGITRIMNVRISPTVGQMNFPRICLEIRECV